MPFCAATTPVSSCISGSSSGPAVAYEFAFNPRKTMSTGPISLGSSVAGGCAVKSPRGEMHADAVALHRLQMRAASDQMHVRAAARERGADERPDRAGADDGDPHGAIPS